MPVLPDFFIAGAPKAGTTSLYEDLQSHPQVCMSNPKETWYFFDHRKYEHELGWYSSQFFDQCKRQKIIGEGTPLYMSHPLVPKRIAENLPESRFIFLLRDPVERAHSQYYFDIQRGVRDPSRSFSEVIRDPHEQTADPDRNHVGLLEMGRYFEQLKRFERHFGPEQLLPLMFSSYIKRREEALREIFDFLGVEYHPITPSEEWNATEHPLNETLFSTLQEGWKVVQKGLGPLSGKLKKFRSTVRSILLSEDFKRPEMKKKDRAYLRNFYQESNSSLASYLDADSLHWH